MEEEFARKIMQVGLKLVSYIMIVLALFSFVDKFFLTTDVFDIFTVIMLIMEGMSIVSFFYSYYLFYRKREHAALFILLPLTVFFLYLTAITSYSFLIALYGTLACIVMLLTVKLPPKVKTVILTVVISVSFSIFFLQNFGIIPMEIQDTTMSIADKIVSTLVILVFYGFIGLSLYTYHIRSVIKGSIEKLYSVYDIMLRSATRIYEYTDREKEVAKCLIYGMSNAEISKQLKISKSTVKFHIKNILDKAAVESKSAYYDKLVDRFMFLSKASKEVTK